MTAFDPDQWLRDFEAAGGSFALLSDGRLWMGKITGGLARVAPVADLVGRPERIDEIKAVVRARYLMR